MVFLLSSGPAFAIGPSFDCNLAKTADEKAICGSAELSEIDFHVDAAFQNAVRAIGRDAAVSIGRNIFDRRHSCGGDISCLSVEMRRGVMVLRSMPRFSISEVERTFRSLPPSEAKAIQTSLTYRDYYNHEIDGSWGPGTQRAIYAMLSASTQEDDGLPYDSPSELLAELARAAAASYEEVGDEDGGNDDELAQSNPLRSDESTTLTASRATAGKSNRSTLSGVMAGIEAEQAEQERRAQEYRAEANLEQQRKIAAQNQAQQQNERLAEMGRAKESEIAAICEGNFTLFGLCWALTLEEMTYTLAARDVFPAEGSQTFFRRGKDDGAVHIFPDRIEMSCHLFETCALTLEKTAELLVERTPLQKMDLAGRHVPGNRYSVYDDIPHCGNTQAGETICVRNGEVTVDQVSYGASKSSVITFARIPPAEPEVEPERYEGVTFD